MKAIYSIILLLAINITQTTLPKNNAVVSAREEASKAGIAMLQKGGNAFDAMIATSLSLAVCYPVAGNLGGGGFAVIRKTNGEVSTLDYREMAPANAFKDMYLDSLGNAIPSKSRLGGLASGVPGTVAGLFEIYEKEGTLPLDTIFAPAIELAEKGFVITEKQARSFNRAYEKIALVNPENLIFKKDFKAGDIFVNKPLANTLRQILKNGNDGFYSGFVAKELVTEIEEAGGIITLEDLKNYEVKWREPIKFDYKDLTLYSMAPPSSGGICLGQIMKMVEHYDLKKYGHNSMKSIQVLVEAERRSYADRSKYLGDPDFFAIPINDLLDSTYLKNRMTNFSFEEATPSSEVNPGNIVWSESEETTHFSIVDTQGNAIAVTTTLNAAYGSKVYIESLGFFMNNEMDDFSVKPGVPNMFGLVGNKANAIAPKKRMLSSMTPTIVEKNGNLSMVVGTPGGSTIITSVLQTILNVYEFDMNMQQAVNAKRFHHQWLPDKIIFEPKSFDSLLLNELRKKGYMIEEKDSRVIGKVDAIFIDEKGNIDTGADPRGDDAAVTF